MASCLVGAKCTSTTSIPSNSPTQPLSTGHRLSPEALIGIVFGVLMLILALIGLWQTRQQRNRSCMLIHPGRFPFSAKRWADDEALPMHEPLGRSQTSHRKAKAGQQPFASHYLMDLDRITVNTFQ